MVDDLRNHDPLPTREERDWMDQGVAAQVLRGLALGVVALAIGVAASLLLEPGMAPDAVAAVAPR